MTNLAIAVCAVVVCFGFPLLSFSIYCWWKDRQRRRAAERRAQAQFVRRLHAINEDTHTVADPHSWTDLVSEPDTRTVLDPHLGPLSVPLESAEPLVFYRLANETALNALRRIGQPTAVGAGWATFDTQEYRGIEVKV